MGLTGDEHAELTAKAAAAGMTLSGFVQALIAADMATRPAPPRSNRNHGTMLLLAEVHLLAMQVKKIGTNLNQLAHQANTGLVPLSLRDLQITRAQVAVAMDKATAVFEKVLHS